MKKILLATDKLIYNEKCPKVNCASREGIVKS